MENKRIYVCGPLAGEQAEAILKDIHDYGGFPIKPVVFGDDEYFNANLCWIEQAGAVLMVGDWQHDKRALSEMHHATIIHTPVFTDVTKLAVAIQAEEISLWS